VNKLPDNQPTTEDKILMAAATIFMKKGMDGARMQEIADEAGINKALLHYYFRNKEQLFQAVFRQAIASVMPLVMEVFIADLPLMEKIPRFLDLHVSFLQGNPMAPHFIISELQRNPEMILDLFRPVIDSGVISQFKADVQKSIEAGEIQPVDPIHLLVNILSMSVFPLLARNLIMKFTSFTPLQFDRFIEERKTTVAKFIIDSLK
jgi:AcrR family transcriptional regulator